MLRNVYAVSAVLLFGGDCSVVVWLRGGCGVVVRLLRGNCCAAVAVLLFGGGCVVCAQRSKGGGCGMCLQWFEELMYQLLNYTHLCRLHHGGGRCGLAMNNNTSP